jgi:hypothetical protein
MIPGTRTKSTRVLKSNDPMIGDPDTIKTFSFGNASASACAIVRQRRMCPNPKLSWL